MRALLSNIERGCLVLDDNWLLQAQLCQSVALRHDYRPAVRDCVAGMPGGFLAVPACDLLKHCAPSQTFLSMFNL